MHLYSFEKLNVWQESRQLVKEIYVLLQFFPSEEKFGLAAQMKRAAVSVSSNIAEGATRSSFKEQCHFYTIAYGSLIELLNQLVLSVDLGFVAAAAYETLRTKIERTGNMLNALRNKQLQRIDK